MAASERASGGGGRSVGFPGLDLRAVRPGVKCSNSGQRESALAIPDRGNGAPCALHDRIVARRIEKMAGQIDIIHTWPTGALETLKTAARLGIPTVLERPNAHTGFAMEVVQKECDRLGVTLPPDHEHAFNAEKLRREEEEYSLATRLLCPSEFVVKTFLDKGFAKEQLVRHIYGYDEKSVLSQR